MASVLAVIGIAVAAPAAASAAPAAAAASAACPGGSLPAIIKINSAGTGYNAPTGVGRLGLTSFVVNAPANPVDPSVYLQTVTATTTVVTTIYRATYTLQITDPDDGPFLTSIADTYPTGQNSINAIFPANGATDFVVRRVELCVGLG